MAFEKIGKDIFKISSTFLLSISQI